MERAEVELEQLTGLQIGNDSVGGIGAKRLINAKALARPAAVRIEEAEDEGEDVPVLINRDLPNLKAVLDDSDAIIQVLDARDPLAFRSSHLEDLAGAKPGRRTLLVLNKIGTFFSHKAHHWASC
jgi:nuclear GTP-binding protein